MSKGFQVGLASENTTFLSLVPLRLIFLSSSGLVLYKYHGKRLSNIRAVPPTVIPSSCAELSCSVTICRDRRLYESPRSLRRDAGVKVYLFLKTGLLIHNVDLCYFMNHFPKRHQENVIETDLNTPGK